MRRQALVLLLGSLVLSGCIGSFQSMDHAQMLTAGQHALKAATISDAELKQLSLNMRRQEDAQAKVAPASSQYQKRLDNLMSKMTSVNGVPLNYKVYMTSEMNANATPDGSVRVYSGLMDKLNDDELRFVLGHEIGHVALGHSLNRMRMAYSTEALKYAAGSLSPTASALSHSQLGDLATSFVKAQFSQSQESDADAYGMQFLKDNHYNTAAAGAALRKISEGSTPGSALDAMFSSHPDSAKRAAKMDSLAKN